MIIKNSIYYNNIEFRLVKFGRRKRHPKTKVAFYVNNGEGGVVGLRLYPDGRMVLVNADKVAWKGKHGKAVYLQFRHAWGREIGILASRAVYSAFYGCIPPGMTIDHINGCTTDNRPENLRQVTNAVNSRDGGFLTKLRNKGINPVTVQKAYLLRYFERMTQVKAILSE
ncbi:MAG: HNH endonuclease, partial [Paludibacteraceae bacterium]|nr:HNH endonuclease [Paludibacteraceae bacterium]